MFTRSMAMFERTFKEFIRNRAVLFWTIGWPAIWLVLSSVLFTSGTPEEWLPQTKGSFTISMIGFGLMTSGIANLAGNIARDKERGIYRKISSMPIKAQEDALGRLLGLLIFTFAGSLIVLVIGFLIGARFGGGILGGSQCIGYAFLMILSASGIGLILGSLVKYEGTSINIGVGVTVLTASISGMFAPYSFLPEVLQQFSRMYPLSTAVSSIIYILEGERFAGYNPLYPEHIIYTIISSLTIFMIGLILYKQRIWSNRP